MSHRMTNGSAALEVSGLRKSYKVGHIVQKRRLALDELSLSVERGEVFGYLGPNGSGKTTTLKVVMGIVRPDAGSVTVLGSPLGEPAWRYHAGYLPEQPYFYDYLTPFEYLDYSGRLFGLATATRRRRADELLERVGLDRSRDVALRRFSKGMSQRLGLAQALINDPEIVFLDEPMSGLDPIGRRLVRDVIMDLKRRGKTVFFSTHILPDAEALCDRVALLGGGRLLRAGRLDEILSLDVSHLEVLIGWHGAAPADAPAGARDRSVLGERWRLEVEEASLVSVLEWAVARRGRVLSVQPIRQSLEDYFFKELVAVEPSGPWVPRD